MAALAAVLGLHRLFRRAAHSGDLNDAWWHAGINVLAVLISLYNFYIRYADPTAAGIKGLIVSLIVVCLLLVSGWKGWEMVYRHHVGVSDEITPLRYYVSRRHAERANPRARRLVAQRREKRLRPPAARARSRPAGNRNAPARPAGSRDHRVGDRRDRDAPVGAALRDRGGDGVVRVRLVGVAGRPRAIEQLSIRTRVPAPALRLTIRQAGSASAALQRRVRTAGLRSAHRRRGT